MANHTTNYTITVTTVFDTRQTQLHELDRPLPTLGQLVDAWVVAAAVFGFITWRTWLYLTGADTLQHRTARGIAVRLWCVAVLHFVLALD